MTDPITRLNAALEGRYRIEREIGEGGMATVYLAEDLRHERKVALKVLKPELAAVVGAERFLAEIKTTANLQHPHILPLFDSGQAESFLYYVMPYVEGESLRERIDRDHQLPVDEAVQIATNMAEALDYAHGQGVIHRDIKPANVLMLSGKPVISDFGIALAVGAAGGGRLTETGLSLGTPHYMSPEQATGDQNVGPQTDTYALGCVLYEMLIGEPPYTGPNAQAVLGQIITAEPVSATKKRASVPVNVDAAIRRALESLPADRFTSAAEFAGALSNPMFQLHPGLPPVRTGVTGRASRYAWPVAALLAAGVAVWALVRPTEPIALSTPTLLSFGLPEGQFLSIASGVLDISRDGGRIVFVVQQERDARLYIRDLGEYRLREVPGTTGAEQPFLSPDGERVGYFAEGRIRVLPVSGGIAIDLAEVSAVAGADWGLDGRILFGSMTDPSLWRVGADGGTPEQIHLVAGDGGDSSATVRGPVVDPNLLPGDRYALATVGWMTSDITEEASRVTAAIDLTTGETRPLLGLPPVSNRSHRAHYIRSGHIVFWAGGGTIFMAPFDLRQRELIGPAMPVADDALRPGGSTASFAASETGTLAYATGGFERELVIVERNGSESGLDVVPRGYRFPDASPDGNYVAVSVDPSPSQMWVVDLRRGTETPVTTEGHNLIPTWSADGSRLLWRRVNRGLYSVSWPVMGEETFIEGTYPSYSYEEGEWISDTELSGHFTVRTADGNPRILGTLDVTTGEMTELLSPSLLPFPGSPTRSREGDWVAYTSDRTGVEEIWVAPFVGGGFGQQVSDGGGTDPHWSPDGSELFYRSGTTIWAIEVRTSPGFEIADSPRALFDAPYDFSYRDNWDVLPDGRFLMIRSDPNVGREVRVMVGWIEGMLADRGN